MKMNLNYSRQRLVIASTQENTDKNEKWIFT